MMQMSTCQTAANEFLRQFWFSLFPSPHDMRSGSFSRLSEQREAKAAKMISYLQTTCEKVEALYSLARQLSIDPSIVETAMAPLMTSVYRALKVYKDCNSG